MEKLLIIIPSVSVLFFKILAFFWKFYFCLSKILSNKNFSTRFFKKISKKNSQKKFSKKFQKKILNKIFSKNFLKILFSIFRGDFHFQQNFERFCSFEFYKNVRVTSTLLDRLYKDGLCRISCHVFHIFIFYFSAYFIFSHC